MVKFNDIFEEDVVVDKLVEKLADSLEKEIIHLDTLGDAGEDYIHSVTGKTVTDAEYDDMRKKLKELRPNSKVFQNITASNYLSEAKKVKHNPPMTSIEKANGTEEEKLAILNKWIKDCGTDDLVMSFKRDGVACALYYVDGKLISAGLRPRDGINGEDITENIKYVENVPLELKEKVTGSFRGELECPISVFNVLNGLGDKIFSNPRNYTTGSIRQFKDPIKTKSRKLRFIVHGIEAIENPSYKTEIEKAKWCNDIGLVFNQLEKFDLKRLEEMEEQVEDLDYEVDGVVLSVNDIDLQEQLGRHGDTPTGNPRAKLAWKFKDTVATVTINNIRSQVGRTGKITPVLEFDPVKLEGTIVTQCTAHNYGIIKKFNLCKDTQIEIKKSGKIIPKFVKVIKESPSVKDFILSDKCPSCSQIIEIVKSDLAEEWYCKNNNCPAKQTESLCHYLTSVGVKGIASSMVNKLTSAGLVKNISDFYKLTYNKLSDAGITDRTALLVVARILMINTPEKLENEQLLQAIDNIQSIGKKVRIPIQDFISALGIKGASEGTASKLVAHFNGDIDKIISATIEDLTQVEEIGEKTAKGLYEYFNSNKELIQDILKYVNLKLPTIGKFTGKNFVFSGGFQDGKKKWEELVIENGGLVSGSVSKKTTYLVAGEGSGLKSAKAKELNIPILSLDDFKDMLKD